MTGQIVCPRCGATNSFMKGYLPRTCVCRVCQSQLGWREIVGCGPDCKAADGPSQTDDPSGGAAPSAPELGADDDTAVGGAADR